MRWTIYYSDDTTISSRDATPFSIPYGRRADVQVIVQESADHNWVTTAGYDYYIWDSRGDETKWWGCDKFGWHHYMLYPGSKCMLFGTMIDKKTFREIYDRARSEFGNKEVFANNERQP